MTEMMTMRRRHPSDDRGIAMLTVILVIAVLGALTVTATALTVNNIGNSGRDRQALGALSSSEAGVAQAVQYLRGTSLGNLTCTEPPPGGAPDTTCTTSSNTWVNANNPKQIRVDGGTGSCVASSDCFKVWIGTVQKYVPNCPARHASPPGQCYGRYRIHSTGVAGNGPGARRLAVDVQLRPLSYPLGVFSEQSFSGNGNVGVHYESIFTAGCMFNRQDDSKSGSGVQFAWDAANNRPALDLFYDQPAAAHAVGDVSTSNTSCGSQGNAGPIHATKACNSTFRFDQTGGAAAGPLTSGDGCYAGYTRSDNTVYPTTSKFGLSDLQSMYGYRPRGLTDAQYDQLRSTAQSQGTYNIPSGSINSVLTSLVNAGISSPVLYWDNGSVSLKSTDFPSSFLRNLDSTAGCTSNNVTIVVAGGSNGLSYQGGNTAPYLSAAIFVPDGTLTGVGGRNTIGTVFAKTIDLGGNLDFYMDNCFASNPPGATVEVTVTNWREDDGTDIN
jgi:type II secretory pathway pseudopilin PulG